MSDLNWIAAANTMPLQTTLSSTQGRSPRRNSVLTHVIRILQRWRERARPHPHLYELDDYILGDIGLTRDALLCESIRSYWR